jgi:hypothetical protein
VLTGLLAHSAVASSQQRGKRVSEEHESAGQPRQQHEHQQHSQQQAATRVCAPSARRARANAGGLELRRLAQMRNMLAVGISNGASNGTSSIASSAAAAGSSSSSSSSSSGNDSAATLTCDGNSSNGSSSTSSRGSGMGRGCRSQNLQQLSARVQQRRSRLRAAPTAAAPTRTAGVAGDSSSTDRSSLPAPAPAPPAAAAVSKHGPAVVEGVHMEAAAGAAKDPAQRGAVPPSKQQRSITRMAVLGGGDEGVAGNSGSSSSSVGNSRSMRNTSSRDTRSGRTAADLVQQLHCMAWARQQAARTPH